MVTRNARGNASDHVGVEDYMDPSLRFGIAGVNLQAYGK
jgi:hypothetical protein